MKREPKKPGQELIPGDIFVVRFPRSHPASTYLIKIEFSLSSGLLLDNRGKNKASALRMSKCAAKSAVRLLKAWHWQYGDDSMEIVPVKK